MRKLFIGIAQAFLLGFGILSAFAAPGKIDITVSVPPHAYFVERIGGDRVLAHIMIPGGANPDTYEPTPRQLINLSNSRMYVKVGAPNFPFENKYISTFLDRSPRMTVIDASRGMKFRGEDHHVWASPALARITAANIAKALVVNDPLHKDEYERNLQEFLAEIDRLDQEIRKSLKEKIGYSFMTYHPAWGYFADEYNIIQIPIEEEGKPGNAAHIRKMIDLARKKGIRDVLVQKGFDARNAQTVAAGLGGKTVEVDPLARDWPQGLKKFTASLKDVLKK
ncbi:MAG: metal ABC transporter solute-binding protein, Zn/Mn family [Syntrophales bacterium]